MPRDKEKQPAASRAPLSDGEKQSMLSVFLRDENAFRTARSRLQVSDFDRDVDGYLALVWAVVNDHYEEFSVLPTEGEVLAEINRRSEGDPTLLTDENVETLNQFISDTYVGSDAVNAQLAFKWLKQFKEDRLAATAREVLADGFTPADLPALLETWTEQAAEATSVQGEGIEKPFRDGWWRAKTIVDRRSTYCACFDELLRGGHAAKESIGLLAPYGGGKTLSMVQLSIGTALYCQDQWFLNEKRGPLGLSYHFTWEEDFESLLIRAICFQALIDKDSLEEVLATKSMRGFSTSNNLKPYERRLFEASISIGRPVDGEIERFRKAQQVLNRNWRIVDMTGASAKQTSRGTGLVEEVSILIDQDLRKFQDHNQLREVGGVFMDYVGAAAERYIMANGLRHNETLRHVISKWPLHAKNLIASRYNCPVWSCHQLTAEANSMAPGVVPKVTDCAEARSFAENLDFCFMYGKMTKESLCVLASVKHRRTEVQPERIVHVNGSLGRIEDVSGIYVLDAVSRKIISREEHRRISGRGSIPDDPNIPEIPSDAVARQVRTARPRNNVDTA